MLIVNKNLLVWSNSNNRWADPSKKTKNAFCFHDMPLTNTWISNTCSVLNLNKPLLLLTNLHDAVLQAHCVAHRCLWSMW